MEVVTYVIYFMYFCIFIFFLYVHTFWKMEQLTLRAKFETLT